MTVRTVGVQLTTAPRGRSLLRLLGPAFVAAVAYVDPGNVAVNVSAGSRYGFLLVWVLVIANLTAVVVQYLSAKLALVTGRSLPELLGESLPAPARIAYWGQAEVVAMATDVAEVLGGAIALHILFGIPLVLGGLIVFVISLGLLHLQAHRGPRVFESVIIGLLAVVVVGFLAGLVVTPVPWRAAAGGLTPSFAGADSVLLAVSMVGATVMPHAIYAHSTLTRDRHVERRRVHAPWRTRRLLAATRWDVVAALLIAGVVNVVMLLVAAASLHGVPGTDTIQGAVGAISTHVGPGVGIAFAVALLASGLASTAVGGYAGGAVMEGLLRVRIPLLARRAISIVPALALLALGADPTHALVVSQVVLSLGIPFALVPLAWCTSRRAVMGDFANARPLRVVAGVVTLAVVVLNLLLLLLATT